MNDHRTFSEKEIAAIFKTAAEKQERLQNQRGTSDGLTLEELQDIGRDSGLTPELIAEAAASLDRHIESEPQPTLLGLPVGVARTVRLTGRLTDENWAGLVAQMRRVFSAHGKLEEMGGLRSWRNGNLQISVESGANGDVLHMRTKKGDAQGRIIVSLGMLLLSFFVIGEATWGSGTDPYSLKVLVISMAILAGLGVFSMPVFRLPQWASRRSSQMDDLADRAEKMVQENGSSRTKVSDNSDKISQSSSVLLDVSDPDEHLDIESANAESVEEIATNRVRAKN